MHFNTCLLAMGYLQAYRNCDRPTHVGRVFKFCNGLVVFGDQGRLAGGGLP